MPGLRPLTPRTGRVALALALGLAALVALALRTWPGGDGDDFDYEAAFEPAPPAAGAIVLALPAIAAKAPADVARTIGEPLACEQTLYAQRCEYARGRTHISYVDGLADWILVREFGEGTPLSAAALARLGLPVAAPAESAARTLTWRGHAGLAEIVLSGGPDGLSHAHVKVLHADPR